MTGKFTYRSGAISYARAEESVVATITPPCKHSYNQVVSRRNAALSHILALPLGTLSDRCVTPFLCANFQTLNNF